MAHIRITRELLEHLLDLPIDVQISLTEPGQPVIVDGVECFVFRTSGALEAGIHALQYEETEHGTSLVSTIPVPE